MALPVSSLSIMCTAIAQFVRDQLDATDNNIRVSIGAPAEAANVSDMHHLNLFFYRVDPAGFGPGTPSDEPMMVRLQLLITAFGILEETIAAGENELRILGEVIRLFHEVPVLASMNVNEEQVQLQMVLQSLSPDDLNHIWSTQKDTAYRPSVAYEVAIGPIVPSVRSTGSPMVGGIGSQLYPRMDARQAPFTGSVVIPPILATTVPIEMEDWAPVICFLVNSNCAQSLNFEAGSDEVNAFTPNVWIAGDTTETVTLRWDIWDRQNGWRADGTTVETQPISIAINPDLAVPGTPETISLPFTDTPGQAVLYAVRSFTRGSDGVQIEVRSNPLLVNLY